MTTISEKIEIIKNEIQEFTDKICALEQQRNNKHQEFLLEVLCNEAVLNESSWIMDENCLKSSVRAHKTLTDLLSTNYHCHFEMNNFNLYFDDDDITIWFMSPNDLKNFVKDFNLKINIDSLLRERKQYEKTIENNQKFLEIIDERIKYLESINNRTLQNR